MIRFLPVPANRRRAQRGSLLQWLTLGRRYSSFTLRTTTRSRRVRRWTRGFNNSANLISSRSTLQSGRRLTAAGASVIFEKLGVLCSGAAWNQRDKDCTRHYHQAADLIRLWRKHQ
jgi:hypothetical protein